MDSAIKAEWITALRSGNYEQGTGLLRQNIFGDEVGFCCLGVLCDIAAGKGLGAWDESGYAVRFHWDNDYAGSNCAVLPKGVTEWAGLPSDEGLLDFTVKADGMDGEEFPTNLTSLNDGGLSFAEIADVIENRL